MNELSTLRPKQTNSECHRRFHRRLAATLSLAVLVIGINPTLSAQIWESVPLSIPGGARGVACDNTGAAYVCGQQRLGFGDYRAVILKNERLGGVDHWTSFTSDTPNMISFSAVTAPSTGIAQGELFALGVTKLTVARPTDTGFVRGWDIYRSTNAGVSWLPINDTPYDAGFYGQQPYGIAADTEGNLYAVGLAHEQVQTRKGTTSYDHWLVRKGKRSIDADGKVSYTWTTVSDLKGTNVWRATGVTCIGTTVFVAGVADSIWQVSKSTNGGSTWSVIDQFNSGAAWTLTSGPAGELISVGSIIKKNTSYFGTRVGTQSGGFQTVDTAPVASLGARAVTTDPFGKVLVAGNGQGNSWTVRQGSQTGGVWSWAASDNIGGTAHPSAIAADSAGNVYAAGSSTNGDDSQWLVRRRLLTTP